MVRRTCRKCLEYYLHEYYCCSFKRVYWWSTVLPVPTELFKIKRYHDYRRCSALDDDRGKDTRRMGQFKCFSILRFDSLKVLYLSRWRQGGTNWYLADPKHYRKRDHV